MFKLLSLLLLLLIPVSASLAESVNHIGFKQFTYTDTMTDRPLPVSLWYPTPDHATVQLIAENSVFYGFRAIKNATTDNTPRPLVLLSHGYRGSWRNQSWLATQLAHNGYIVAAVDHPGTTTFDHDKIQAAKLWQRPHDLSRVINALSENSALAGKINPDRITAIGHSLGGWTVMALAGGHFSVDQFLSDCQLHANPAICGLAKELGITSNNAARFNENVADARIKAVVSLDLGLARGFTAHSLARISIPVLLIGAGTNIADMPVNKESGYIAAHLAESKSAYQVIPQATHFSFFTLCKPGAQALLENDSPGDGIICQDQERNAIHQQATQRIFDFLTRAIGE